MIHKTDDVCRGIREAAGELGARHRDGGTGALMPFVMQQR